MNLQEFNVKEEEARHIAQILQINKVTHRIISFYYPFYHGMWAHTVLNMGFNLLEDSGVCSLSKGLQKYGEFHP